MTLTLNRQLLTSRQILVAFSGGLDSTVLLHQLVQWRTENPGVTLRAIHVHHGLSANADAWVTHCENVCQQWQVPLVVERVQLAQEGLGIEAQARQARYQAFARTLLPGEVLVTAQHLDDQCETFLLALKRGSGPAGLSAMAEVEKEFGFPVYSVVDVYDIIEYLEEDPKNEENVTRIKNYLAVNGAK